MSGAARAPATRPRPGQDWRSGAAVALTVVIGDPGSWVLGLLGFAARGGLLLLALPMLTIPSPVLLSILFRGEVGAVGAGQAGGIALAVALVVSILLVTGLWVSAYAEVVLAERVLSDPDTLGPRAGRPPRPLSGPERRALVLWVAAIGAAALAPVVMLGTFVTWRLGGLVTDELTTPAGSEMPLAVRVLSGAVPELVALLLLLAMAEVLVSLATRRLMVRTWHLAAGPDPGVTTNAPAGAAAEDGPVDEAAEDGPVDEAAGPGTAEVVRCVTDITARLVRQPFAVLATASAEWLLLLVVVGGVMLATSVGWSGVREVVVTSAAPPDPIALLAAVAVLAIFSAAWLGGLALVGCAAALRSTLWTVDALR